MPWYLTPKSSTTRSKHIGLCLCFHKPGVILLWKYPCFDKHYYNNCCAKIPACGNPYISFINFMYNHPSFVDFSLSPYYLMKYSGKLLSFSRMYLYCALGVLMYKFLMSDVTNLDPSVDISLLRNNLTVSKSALGVTQSPGHFIFPHLPLTLFGFYRLFLHACLIPPYHR